MYFILHKTPNDSKIVEHHACHKNIQATMKKLAQTFINTNAGYTMKDNGDSILVHKKIDAKYYFYSSQTVEYVCTYEIQNYNMDKRSQKAFAKNLVKQEKKLKKTEVVEKKPMNLFDELNKNSTFNKMRTHVQLH